MLRGDLGRNGTRNWSGFGDALKNRIKVNNSYSCESSGTVFEWVTGTELRSVTGTEMVFVRVPKVEVVREGYVPLLTS